MDFELSDEQRLLQDAANRFVAQRYDLKRRNEIATRDPGYSDENWKKFAELGWLCLGFEEDFGGLPDAHVEIMLLAEAFGRALLVEPYYSTVIIAGQLLAIGGTSEQKKDIIPRIVNGDTKLAFAHAEPGRRFDLEDISTAATRSGNGFALNGRKCVVLDAPSADYLIVTARVEGAPGVSLFLLDSNASGVERHDFVTTDGRRASEVELKNVKVTKDALVGEAGKAMSVLEAVADQAVAFACADAVGAMDHLLATTLDYVKTRKQFGVPLGKFQVLQHRLTDLYVSLELAKSMSLYATLNLQMPAPQRALAVSMAKIQVIEAARLIGRQAIQLHGAIGMTNELHVGHYFKRLLVFESLFGDADFHARRVEALQAA